MLLLLFSVQSTSGIESPTNDLKLRRNGNKNQSNEITKENAIDSQSIEIVTHQSKSSWRNKREDYVGQERRVWILIGN